MKHIFGGLIIGNLIAYMIFKTSIELSFIMLSIYVGIYLICESYKETFALGREKE